MRSQSWWWNETKLVSVYKGVDDDEMSQVVVLVVVVVVIENAQTKRLMYLYRLLVLMLMLMMGRRWMYSLRQGGGRGMIMIQMMALPAHTTCHRD